MSDDILVDGEKCDCCEGTHPYHREWCYTTEAWIVNKSIHKLTLDRIEKQNDFIQRLMQELSQHGWGDFHYGTQIEQDRDIVALLEEGGFQYDRDSKPETQSDFVIMQEGNIYERGSDLHTD